VSPHPPAEGAVQPSTGRPDLPDLAHLLGDALPAVLADCERQVGAISRVERAVGGNVSHVFRLHAANGSIIVKIRSDRFARIPTLTTDPTLIADERHALVIYGDRVPGVFPQVITFHPDAHAMILSDIFPDHRTYHEHLTDRAATVEEMGRLGRTLRRVHALTRDVAVQIRSQGDAWFREHTFDFCLRFTGHPVLTQACRDMAAHPVQQLVLGDLAPKNLSLAGGGVAICDLDNVHRGWPGYDLAYILAHLLLHHLRWPQPLPDLAAALLAGYHGRPLRDPAGAEELLLATVTAGVLCYRLASTTVPYPLAGKPGLADQFHRRVLSLLDADAATVPELIRAAGADA
jgi:hypothetical protein